MTTAATPSGDVGPAPGRPDVAFTEPWQARAFALAVTTVDGLGLPWEAFRDRLKAAIAEDPERPYYESWVSALESLLADADAGVAVR